MTRATRCPECQKRAESRRNQIRTWYKADWPKIRSRTLAAHPFCTICGARDDLTVDHIRPIAHGGTHDPENLRVLCRPHNSFAGGSVRR